MVKKPDYELPTYDARLFTWDGGKGLTEASDMHLAPGVVPGKRVWNDACDVGFYVRSPKTGTTKLFVNDGPLYRDVGSEREYLGERYISIDGWAESGKFELFIAND